MNQSSVADNEQTLLRAGELVRVGGVIAFRTDTFYGLGADPFNRQAVERIFELKGREEGKPILIVISDRDQCARFIAVKSSSLDFLAQRFWPGPLTLVGTAARDLPPTLTANTGTIGVRLPHDEPVQIGRAHV